MRRFFMVCRLGSFLLGLFILLSLLTGGAKAAQMAAADTLLVPEQRTHDGRFRDMSGLRCADAVKTSFDTGLLEGRQADRFDAVSELTNAQIPPGCMTGSPEAAALRLRRWGRRGISLL